MFHFKGENMKTVVSFLSVALLSLVFSAGSCGKLKNCSEGKKDNCTKKEEFEEKKECIFEPTVADVLAGKTGDDDKSCQDKTEADKIAGAKAAVKECASGTDQTTCDAAKAALAAKGTEAEGKGYECKFENNACKAHK